MVEQGGEGVGELADGDAFMVAGFDFFHDGAASFEHVVEEFEFYIGEVAVLPVVELLAQGVLVGAPAAQRFDGDIELGFDEAEVVIVLIKQVEGLDFVVEGVNGWHGISLLCGGMD